MHAWAFFGNLFPQSGFPILHHKLLLKLLCLPKVVYIVVREHVCLGPAVAEQIQEAQLHMWIWHMSFAGYF